MQQMTPVVTLSSAATKNMHVYWGTCALYKSLEVPFQGTPDFFFPPEKTNYRVAKWLGQTQ